MIPVTWNALVRRTMKAVLPISKEAERGSREGIKPAVWGQGKRYRINKNTGNVPVTMSLT